MSQSDVSVDPKSVACPSCGATAGGWCKRPSGHSGPMVAFHAARRKAAEAASVPPVEPVEQPAKSAASGVQPTAAPGTLAWALNVHARVKAEQDDATLTFVRLGDFYESFGDDAVTAAAALDIVLTSVPGSSGRVAMTGVPWHAAENCFARLLARGHKVVVVEPDETTRPLTAAVASEYRARADEAEPLALFLAVPKSAITGPRVMVQMSLF